MVKKVNKKVTNDLDTSFDIWEPTRSNTFICYIQGTPSFLLKNVERPKVIRYRKWFGLGKITYKWLPMKLSAYDPVSPSGAQAFIECLYRNRPFDFTIKLLGPVGDAVEEWEIHRTKIIYLDFGSLNRENEGLPTEINATIKYKYARLIF